MKTRNFAPVALGIQPRSSLPERRNSWNHEEIPLSFSGFDLKSHTLRNLTMCDSLFSPALQFGCNNVSTGMSRLAPGMVVFSSLLTVEINRIAELD